MKYIIKRIIIGTGIALSVFFLKGLILNVQALEVDVKPDSFNLGNNLFTSNSVISGQFTYYGSNTTTYNIYQSYPTLPTFSGTDWLYLPYSTFSNYQFCVETQNTGSVNGVFLNAYSGQSNPFNSNVKVQIQTLDQAQTLSDCSLTSSDAARVEFNCNNVDFTKNYRLILTNIRSSQYFIRKTLDIQCIAPDSTNSDIINNNNNNTTNIINNITNTSEQIINNQNENTDRQIESQKVCNVYDSSSIKDNGMYLTDSGLTWNNSTFGITDYINIQSSSIEVVSNTDGVAPSLCFYNVNKSLISCISNSNLSLGYEVPIPDNASYVRFSIHNEHNRPQFKICQNGNQSVSNGLQDLNNTLNDSNTPSENAVKQKFAEFGIALDTPISDIVTIPIDLLQAYVNGFNASCSPFSLGTLFNHELVLPCINLESKLGSNLWHIIDLMFSIFMIYNIGMLLIHFYDSLTSLNDLTPEIFRGGN